MSIKNIIFLTVSLIIVSLTVNFVGCGGGGSGGGGGGGGGGFFTDKSANVPVSETNGGSFTTAGKGVSANTIFLTWLDLQLSETGPTALYSYIAKSDDGGDTWTRSANFSEGMENAPLAMLEGPDGFIYLVYVAYSPTAIVKFFKVDPSSLSFSEINVPAIVGVEASDRADMVFDSVGNLYLVLWGGNRITYNVSIHLLKLAAAASSFEYIGKVDEVINNNTIVEEKLVLAFIDKPSIAVDSANNVYIAYSKLPDINSPTRQLYMKTYNGSIFSDALRVNSVDTSNGTVNPRLAIDSSDKVHIIWWEIGSVDEVAVTYDQILYYAMKKPIEANFSAQREIFNMGTFSIPNAIITNNEYALMFEVRPDLIVSSDDVLHLAFYSQSDFLSNISYSKSADNGASWSTPIHASSTSGVSFTIYEPTPQVSLFIDAAGKVYVLGALQHESAGPWKLLFVIGSDS